jgi:hypothetical protein
MASAYALVATPTPTAATSVMPLDMPAKQPARAATNPWPDRDEILAPYLAHQADTLADIDHHLNMQKYALACG